MRNMTRRRALMIGSSQSESIVPREYREVQWLRGTGTQYSQSNYKFIQDIDCIILDATVLNLNNSKLSVVWDDFFIGTTDYPDKWGFEINNGNITVYYGVLNPVPPYTPDSFKEVYALSNYGNTPLDLLCKLDVHNNIIVINETQTRIMALTQGVSTYNLLIGGKYTGASNITAVNNDTYIKRISLYKNDELISYLIPCYRKSDNKPGFYETGTGTFLTNLGSGSDWLIGPNM